MDNQYQVQATALSGRAGSVATSDGNHRFELIEPAAHGSAPDGASPEQLLAAGYAACLMSAIRGVANERQIQLPIDANVTVRIGLNRPDREPNGIDFDFFVGVDLPDVDGPTANEIVADAHERCPFSRALNRVTPVRTSCV